MVWQLKWQFFALLAVVLPLTVATKFIPTGDMSFNESLYQNKMREFLTAQQAVTKQLSTNKPLQALLFTYQQCEAGVLVLSPSDAWDAVVSRRAGPAQIYKYRYKDYMGDEQPKYRATFNEFYNILVFPISQENRRQPILALISTPACMQTIQGIDWNKFWPH